MVGDSCLACQEDENVKCLGISHSMHFVSAFDEKAYRPNDKSVRFSYRADRDCCTIYDFSYCECVELSGDRNALIVSLVFA